jgi:hypothetical protein
MNNLKEVEHSNDASTISISRTYHDLSHLISQDMQVYPGDPQPRFEPFATMEKDKINVTRIVLDSHTGTHVDAPKHFFADGNGIDSEPLVELIEKGLREQKDISNIDSYVEDTGEVDWLILDAINKEIPIPVIFQSTMELFKSRTKDSDTYGFGGHPFGKDDSIAQERKTSRIQKL